MFYFIFQSFPNTLKPNCVSDFVTITYETVQSQKEEKSKSMILGQYTFSGVWD